MLEGEASAFAEGVVGQGVMTVGETERGETALRVSATENVGATVVAAEKGAVPVRESGWEPSSSLSTS